MSISAQTASSLFRIRPHAIEQSVRVPRVYFLLLEAKKSLVLKYKFSFGEKLSFEGGVGGGGGGSGKVLQAVNCARTNAMLI